MNANLYQYRIKLLDLDNLEDKEKILLPKQEYKMTILYPLTHPHTVRIITGSNGMTRSELGKIILYEYKKIYSDDEAVSGRPTYHHTEPRRIMSLGPYGIWGHDLEELWLQSLEVDPDKKEIHLKITSKFKTYEYKYK